MRLRHSVLAAAAVALAAIAGPAEAQNLVLGMTHDKSGPWFSLTRHQTIAVDMAIEEINAAGGVNGKKIEVRVFDAAGKPDQAVVAVRRFAQDDKALAIVGPFSSSQCRIAFPAGDREGIVQMATASSAPGLTKPHPFAFRNTTNEAYLLERLMRAVKDKGVAAKGAAVAYADDEVISKTLGTSVFPDLFKAAGIPLTDTVSFKLASFDLSAQVSQLKAKPFDLIGMGATPENAITMANELNRQGIKARMISGTPLADTTLPQRMGKAGDGTLVATTFFAFVDDARTRKFTDEFIRRVKASGSTVDPTPNQYDASAYDAVYLYAEGMKRARVTGDPAKVADERKALRDALATIKDFPAIAGKMSFDADRDAVKTAHIIEAENAAWRLLASYEPGK